MGLGVHLVMADGSLTSHEARVVGGDWQEGVGLHWDVPGGGDVRKGDGWGGRGCGRGQGGGIPHLLLAADVEDSKGDQAEDDEAGASSLQQAAAREQADQCVVLDHLLWFHKFCL